MKIEKVDICVNRKGQLCEYPGLSKAKASGTGFNETTLVELPINFLYASENEDVRNSLNILGQTGVVFGFDKKYIDPDKGW